MLTKVNTPSTWITISTVIKLPYSFFPPLPEIPARDGFNQHTNPARMAPKRAATVKGVVFIRKGAFMTRIVAIRKVLPRI